MPTLVNCSSCGHRRYVADETLPFGVRCPKCDVTFMDPITPAVWQPAAGLRRRAVARTRHGCVTAWLLVIVVANAVYAVAALAFAAVIAAEKGLLNDPTPWLLGVEAALSVVSVVFAVALLRWRKWGFYGFAGILVVGFLVNLATGHFLYAFGLAVGAVIFLALFYGVMQLGTPSTWSQMD